MCLVIIGRVGGMIVRGRGSYPQMEKIEEGIPES